ncbi:MAG: phage antirepressor N-terminal domain-containing protein [Bacteroidales bacterium]
MSEITPIKYFETSQYGAVDFEGCHVPCAFGGEPGEFTAFILIQGVCQIIGLPVEEEIARIQGSHLLKDGLFMVSFPTVGEDGKTTRRDFHVITLQRLHTWLALIPPESVDNEDMKQKLIVTQKELSDVVYAYFGRRILPQEIRAEDDRYLQPDRKALYEKLEEASQLGDRLNYVTQQLGQLSERVNRLAITISVGEESENITADQQEQLKAMVDVLAHRYEEKHGKGTRGAMINDLKAQHNFRFYNTVSKDAWAGLVRDCIQRFRFLNPRGTPLPRVFQIALDGIEQGSLF